MRKNPNILATAMGWSSQGRDFKNFSNCRMMNQLVHMDNKKDSSTVWLFYPTWWLS